MKKFTVINEEFTCEVCGKLNPPAQATCRNHCRECLCSKHVDKNPGDRSENCQGTLIPIDIEITGAEMKSIIFKCQKCGQTRKNKIAVDDNREKLFEVLEKKSVS